MVGRMARSSLQTVLKLVNSLIGLAGMGMILFSLWMIRGWYKQFGSSDSNPPWFIFTFLGLGVFFCFITCSGHIAAETVNGHCLSCYTVLLFFILILEAAIVADIFLNGNWEEDFPEDPTGKFDELKSFVRSNAEMCEWVSLSVVAAQAVSVFLAMVLRALGPDPGSYYDSDDELVPTRLPLLRNQSQHATYPIDPNLSQQGASWNIKIHDKANN
ncbi:tetraspanin family protein [Carex rostrata]